MANGKQQSWHRDKLSSKGYRDRRENVNYVDFAKNRPMHFVFPTLHLIVLGQLNYLNRYVRCEIITMQRVKTGRPQCIIHINTSQPNPSHPHCIRTRNLSFFHSTHLFGSPSYPFQKRVVFGFYFSGTQVLILTPVAKQGPLPEWATAIGNDVVNQSIAGNIGSH